MELAVPITQALAAILGYLAAKSIDAIIGKWVAMIVIAFEKSASDRARAEYRATMDRITKNLAERSKEWKEWRERRRTP